ncbi:hypothetical protein BN1723_018034, partial [Verticillium longisporum]
YKEQAFEFSCRFHRTKRDKKVDGDSLDDDERILNAAKALKEGEICQLQYFKGDIFAGVVVENRKDERMLLVDILPNGARVEVEWKWLLVADPSDYHLPKASARAIPMPTSQKAKQELNAKRAVDEVPRKDDTFVDGGFTWAEFHTCEPFHNTGQVKVDLDKDTQLCDTKVGIKLLVAFTNNWADYGGMDVYTVNLGGKYHDDFYRVPEIKDAYKRYVKAFVERYKDSPTIFAWELMNEPRCGADGVRNLPRSPAGCNPAVMSAWTDEMSTFVRSIDPYHLITWGGEGAFNRESDDWAYNGADGSDFDHEMTLKNIDFGTFHLYPDWWSKTVEWSNQWIGFVTTKGTKFRLDGKDFPFAGSNAYYFPFDNNQADVEAGLTAAKDAGLKVFRTWGFNDKNATSDFQNGMPKYGGEGAGATEVILQKWYDNGTSVINLEPFDKVVDAATKVGIKLLVAFTNNWADYGGMDVYTVNLGGKYHD